MKLFIALMACATILSAQIAVESHALGGAGYSNEQGGFVVGQPYGVATESGLIGFWIEVAAHDPGPVVSIPVIALNQGIQVGFTPASALVRFENINTAQGRVRALSLNGSLIAELWSGQLDKGSQEIQVSFKDLSRTPMILVIENGKSRRSYRFTPSSK